MAPTETERDYDLWFASKKEAFKNAEVVVFGAGYVGGEVVRLLCQAGARVTALTRNAERGHQLAGYGAQVFCTDILDSRWKKDLPRSPQFLLCSLGSGGGGPDSYRRNYCGGMENIIDWASGCAIEAFVYTSSTSVYPQSGGVTVDESAPVGGGRESVRSLIDAESILLEANLPDLRRRYVLRSGGIYGPGRHAWLDRLLSGATVLEGDSAGHVNLVHRDDLCGAILSAWTVLDEREKGIFNVVDDGRARRSEIVGWLASKLGRMPPSFTGVAGTRGSSDRILLNERCKQYLGWRLRYPSFREGYEAILKDLQLGA